MRPHPLPPSLRRASGFVEWDDTPSFADSLSDRLNWRARSQGAERRTVEVYPDTMPAELVPAPASTTFSEPVEGLAVREVTDIDVFRHFFSAALAAS